MKKIIAAVILIFGLSQLSNITGQKLNKTPDKKSKQITAQEIKPSVSPLITAAGAFSDGNGVLLKWQTGAEADLIGFNIYRTNGNEKIRINQYLILSALIRKGENSKFGNDYDFFDGQGVFQNSYLIETVYFNGKKDLLSPILPRYTSDLLNVFSSSSESLRQSKSASQPVIETSKLALPGKLNNRQASDQLLEDPDMQKGLPRSRVSKLQFQKKAFTAFRGLNCKQPDLMLIQIPLNGSFISTVFNNPLLLKQPVSISNFTVQILQIPRKPENKFIF